MFTLAIVQSALELGFIYALVAMALFLSFRVPVSYTHLDVYKRQGLHCTTSTLPARRTPACAPN